MKHVVLFNYGGPERSSQIQDYLYRLFSDKNVFQLPGGKLYQKPLAWIISQIRTKKVTPNYETIGGSPLLSLTRALVQKLNTRKTSRYYLALAYMSPFISDVLNAIPEQEAYLFPLFPHFSHTTTGACLSLAKKSPLKIFYLKEYWSDPDFNALIIERIIHLKPSEKTAVLFSAHSIPVKYAEQGDSYLESIQKHFSLLQTFLPQYSLFLGFQSKIGPGKWANPDLEDVLASIKDQGFQGLILYPLSFVIDNYETAFEIDKSYKAIINSRYNLSFVRIPCLNDADDFVSFIERKVSDERWSELV